MIKNKYYYISDIKGTTKGILGELLFKNYKKNIFCTKLCNPHILDNLPFKIPKKVAIFLKENWYTLDCFEFVLDQDNNSFVNIILHEVKTMNYLENMPKLYNRIKFTSNQIIIYEKAQRIGIIVKIAKIILFDSGKYLINILDFNSKKYNYQVCNGSKKFQKKLTL